MLMIATRSGCWGGRKRIAVEHTQTPRSASGRLAECGLCRRTRTSGNYRVQVARSLVSDLAGRVLAGRYLLHTAVGTGASGRVYVAEDTRLKRRVAVKILHAALAEDAAFLRR